MRCGTFRGFRRHQRRREDPCFACRLAAAQYAEDRRLAPQRRAVLDAEVAIFEKRRQRASLP